MTCVRCAAPIPEDEAAVELCQTCWDWCALRDPRIVRRDLEIRKASAYETAAELAKRYGLSKRSIYRICQ